MMIAAGLDPQDLVSDSRLDEYDAEQLVRVIEAGESQSTGHDRSSYQPRLDRALMAWTGGELLEGVDESWSMFRARVQSVLSDLRQRSGMTIAVSSGGVISGICSQLWGANAGVWQSMSRVAVNGGISKVAMGRSGLNVLTFNDHAHLEGQMSSRISYR